MIFNPARISGAWILDIEAQRDERGFLARIWCQRELTEHGLEPSLAQESLSHSRCKGTLRGMHFQRAPHEEVKIVRCLRGAVYDVIVDLRPRSPTFRTWQGIELSAENRGAIYVPKGCAHGFQTLVDDSEVLYQISVPYAPENADGYCYDDPAFAIAWPLPVSVISERDLAWPKFAAR